MLSRLRLALQAKHGGKLGGDVEADETFIGGKARNMHKAKRKRLGISQGRSMVGKVAVMGLLERHGEGRHSAGPHCRSSRTASDIMLEPIIDAARRSRRDRLHRRAASYRPDWQRGYIHNVIDHAEAYADGQVHTNGLENFWTC